MDGIERLHSIMTRLRDPEKGCPWDREQTLSTLKPCVLEETYELLAGVHGGVPPYKVCCCFRLILVYSLYRVFTSMNNSFYRL